MPQALLELCKTSRDTLQQCENTNLEIYCHSGQGALLGTRRGGREQSQDSTVTISTGYRGQHSHHPLWVQGTALSQSPLGTGDDPSHQCSHGVRTMSHTCSAQPLGTTPSCHREIHHSGGVPAPAHGFVRDKPGGVSPPDTS